MELVRLVMDIYNDLIRIQELDENRFSATHLNDSTLVKTFHSNNHNDDFNYEKQQLKTNDSVFSSHGANLNKMNSCDSLKNGKNTALNDAINNLEKINLNKSTSSDYLNKVLDELKASRDHHSHKETSSTSFNSSNINNANNTDLDEDESRMKVVSANDIIKKSYDNLNVDNEVEKYNNVPLNEDPDPIIIKKENNEQVVYKQNVFIRWLQPPTPPPPAPIIIREVQEPQEQLPPLVIYKQAPRAATPPPLVIRERPPTPIQTSQDPLVIERRVVAPKEQRKIIIEHLPAPPAKPRDIILEKWLPKEQPARQIYVQKAVCRPTFQRPIYEIVDAQQQTQHKPRRDIYEIMEKPRSLNKKTSKKYMKRSDSNEFIYSPRKVYSPLNSLQQVQPYQQQQEVYCTSQQIRKPKVAGYRIIRQVGIFRI